MASLANSGYPERVTTMNVSLPDELRAFVDEQVDEGHYGSTSEYVRALIRRDQDRRRLRSLLLDGAASTPGPVADGTYFAMLRRRLAPDD
ncbi:type II toxin-antitoxin system ParD family antitoxin [soil metagenome]